MGTLHFVCPTNGHEVVTGLEVGSASLANLNIHRVGCPECGRTHRMGEVRPWVASDNLANCFCLGTLRFVCPASGREVDTGIEVDLVTFKSLYRERLGCPECLGTHELSEIKAWVGNKPSPEPAE